MQGEKRLEKLQCLPKGQVDEQPGNTRFKCLKRRKQQHFCPRRAITGFFYVYLQRHTIKNKILFYRFAHLYCILSPSLLTLRPFARKKSRKVFIITWKPKYFPYSGHRYGAVTLYRHLYSHSPIQQKSLCRFSYIKFKLRLLKLNRGLNSAVGGYRGR